ncbi:MAG: cytidine deaminase [Candidatus Nanoarchaeia archaeon]|nr:cytidine deaminase [Candidatus Nanoarchaeia archaeon]
MNKTTIEEKEIMRLKAIKAMNYAFSVNSNHNIGACILTNNGNFYEGCNVENSISGLGNCAERNAVNNAVAHGEYSFKSILVIHDGKDPVYPCGMCLQYLLEFSQVSQSDIEIIMCNLDGKEQKSTVRKLLPHGYYTDEKSHNLSKFRGFD